MNVEIYSLFNLFLVYETIKSICPYNCNEKNFKNRNFDVTRNKQYSVDFTFLHYV